MQGAALGEGTRLHLFGACLLCVGWGGEGCVLPWQGPNPTLLSLSTGMEAYPITVWAGWGPGEISQGYKPGAISQAHLLTGCVGAVLLPLLRPK